MDTLINLTFPFWDGNRKRKKIVFLICRTGTTITNQLLCNFRAGTGITKKDFTLFRTGTRNPKKSSRSLGTGIQGVSVGKSTRMGIPAHACYGYPIPSIKIYMPKNIIMLYRTKKIMPAIPQPQSHILPKAGRIKLLTFFLTHVI